MAVHLGRADLHRLHEPERDEWDLMLAALSAALADQAVALRNQFPDIYARVDAILEDPARVRVGRWTRAASAIDGYHAAGTYSNE
jgi:hypothetical protein